MSRLRAEILLLLCAVSWSIAYFNVREAGLELNAVTVVFYRYLIGTFCLFPFATRISARPGRDFVAGSVLGVILALLLLCITAGVQQSSIQNAGFLVGSFVVLVPLFVWLLDGTWLSKLDQGALVCALGGIWIVTGGVTRLATGDLLFLSGALLTALHIVLVTRFTKWGVDPLFNTFLQCVTVGVVSGVCVLLLGIPLMLPTITAFWHLLFLGVVASSICLCLQLIGQRYTSEWRASLIYSIEPLIALGVASFISGEQVRFETLIGGALILLALVVSSIGLKRAQS